LREHTNPTRAAPFHFSGDGLATGFDLLGGEPTAVERLQAEFTEGDIVALPRNAGTTAAVHFAVLNSGWNCGGH
jgi:hypothetical protein